MYLDKKAETGKATVELNDNNIIVCRLSGEITGSIVAESMHKTRHLARQVRAEGKKPLLLIDISKITKQTSRARTHAKELNSMGFSRIAVSGGSQALVLIGRYIARVGGMEKYARFFKRERAALNWLVSGFEKKVVDPSLAARSLTALILAVLAISTLVGWGLDVPVLRSVIPDLAPMNPMAAISVLIIAAAFLCMGKNWRSARLRQFIVMIAGAWSLFFGASILLSHIFQIDMGLDNLLFSDVLNTGGFSGRAAPGVGMLFVAAGLMFGLLLTGQRRAWQRYAFFVVSGAVFVVTVSVLLGYGFGFHYLTDLGSATPISITTTLAFICFNFMAARLSRPIPAYAWSSKVFNSYWQAIVVSFVLILMTGVSWQQAKLNVARSVEATSSESFAKIQNSLASRMQAYVDAVNGYKGLFAASEDISPLEFNKYFINSNIQINYPGFLAITYVSSVPDAQKQSYINQTRQRASEAYPKYGSFTLFPENKNSTHYPLVYVEPQTPTTRYGYDLSSEAVRRETLEKTRDTGDLVGSEIIDLNASQAGDAPERPGFFITVPMYKGSTHTPETVAERQKTIHGFILAYFQNDRLFADVFSSAKDQNAQYSLVDISSGKMVYDPKNPGIDNDGRIAYSSVISAGGKQWRLSMKVSKDFGMTEVYRRLPRSVLSIGIIVSILAFFVVYGQLRKRDQALKTAAEMTEDLNNERNDAIANQYRVEAILASIGDAVFAVDVKGRLTLFNLACQQISGYSANEAIGKHYADVLDFTFEKTGKVNDSFIREALNGRLTSMKNHTILRRKDGKSVAVADSAAPIYDVHGKLLGAIVVFRDVSKEYELDRAKTEFVSLASHQLRTPLSAINWYGELLLGGDAGKLNNDQKEYIEQIHKGSLRMIELVNALLDVSRLDLGKLSNHPSPNDMTELAEGLKNELMTIIQTKDLQVRIDAEKSLPTVSADPKLLRMIIQNLFSNAVKYTPQQGEVTLTLRRAMSEETSKIHLRGESYLYLVVEDTGYGIPETQHHKIFGKLFRADNVQALDVEGTGLGLYIVKQVVEKLGGKIWFESAENKGTTFYVLLPFKTKVLKSNSKQPGGV